MVYGIALIMMNAFLGASVLYSIVLNACVDAC